MQEDLEMLAIAGRSAAEQVEQTMLEDPEGLALAGSNSPSGTGEAANLLASFDPFLLGHRDKSDLIEKAHYKKVFRKAGWISPVILVGGKVVGTWDYTRLGKRLRVVLRPFDGALQMSGEGPRDMRCELRRMFEDEVDDVRRFLGFEQVEVNLD